MAKRDNLIRIGIGLFALLFLAVPLWRYWRGGDKPPANSGNVARQQSTASNSVTSDRTPGRPVTPIEMLHAAASLEEAVAVMNLLPISFAPNSPQLAPESQPYIEETAAAIRRLAAGRKVEIVVTAADPRSAEAKARSLQAALVSRGVEPSSLSARADTDAASAVERVTYRIAQGSSSPTPKNRR